MDNKGAKLECDGEQGRGLTSDVDLVRGSWPRGRGKRGEEGQGYGQCPQRMEVKGDGKGCIRGLREKKWKQWRRGKEEEKGVAGLIIKSSGQGKRKKSETG